MMNSGDVRVLGRVVLMAAAGLLSLGVPGPLGLLGPLGPLGSLGAEETAEGRTRIAFFTPTTEGNTYWPQVYRILRAAAEDLGVELEAHEFDVADRFAKQRQGVEVLKARPRPDGAVFSVAFGQARPLLEAAEELGIPSFLQGPLFPSELERLGGAPRREYGSWIALFRQDEERKGYLLGKRLIGAARRGECLADDGRIHAAGIGGDRSWLGSALREEGLMRAVDEAADEAAADPGLAGVKLVQTVSTQWTPAEGRAMTERLLDRYPGISVVWAASDQLAIGAVEALREAGRVPGKDVFVGGLDLSRNGLRYVQRGELEATVSGSLLAYARVLILLYDYLHGYDFAPEMGTTVDARIYTADRDNAEFYLSFFRDVEGIDFSLFSKAAGGSSGGYDFSLERFHDAKR